MLNRAIGGAYGLGTDIGGYFDIDHPPDHQGAVHPLGRVGGARPVFRLHGPARPAPTRPGASTTRRCGSTSSSPAPPAGRAADPPALAAGGPPGCPRPGPLWLAYPDDRRAGAQDQEWLLGPDVLVAPVVEQGATSRSVVLPARLLAISRNGTAPQGTYLECRPGASECPALLLPVRQPSVKASGDRSNKLADPCRVVATNDRAPATSVKGPKPRGSFVHRVVARSPAPRVYCLWQPGRSARQVLANQLLVVGAGPFCSRSITHAVLALSLPRLEQESASGQASAARWACSRN